LSRMLSDETIIEFAGLGRVAGPSGLFLRLPLRKALRVHNELDYI
jgi:hypothetical protein